MLTMKFFMLCWMAAVLLTAAPDQNCTGLAATNFGADVKINSAKLVPAAANMPEHCDVRGVIWPEARFVVKLPTNWNNRFQMAGNGAFAGTISMGPVDAAVRAGYAATSTDTGHDAQKEPGATFAVPGATNVNAGRKVIDFGYLAVHETALLAKKIIRAAYGRDARYSYWIGCSTGGRQGLIEAQRYPEDFDGYVIGAPALNLSGLNIKNIWNWIAVGPGPGEIKPTKLSALADAVYSKCDALDGLKDGLIDNPLICNFDPTVELKKCAEQDEPTCFTAAQIAGVKKVYDGARDSAGKQLFPGLVPGAEAVGPGTGVRSGVLRSGWDGALNGSFGLGDSFMKYVAFNPPSGASWDYHTYDFDKDPNRMRDIGLILDATVSDLTAVKARGGKILHYHGWADAGITARLSVEYYLAAMKTMGEKETKEFYRFFPVAGMFHCGGGPGCGDADWLGAVVNWVEKGIAPEVIVGAHVEDQQTTRTRPICAYPSVARYKGSGSIDVAENFSCVVQ